METVEGTGDWRETTLTGEESAGYRVLRITLRPVSVNRDAAIETPEDALLAVWIRLTQGAQAT